MTLFRKLFVSILFFFVALTAYAQSYSIRGCVCEERKNTPITGAVLRLGEDYLWTMTDAQGGFVFDNVQAGQYEIEISCLGYVTIKKPLTLQQDVNELVFKLSENSLALDEVLVTAKRSDGLNTSHNLGRDALNHLQVTSLTDISSLLPGGKTVNPDLTTANSFSLRSGGSTMGNAAFGTAVEVDGVRIGNNASFGEMKGVNTRSVAVENIESVELITGVPSAEYGDMNSGVVKIHTRKGYTPVNITFSINPRTYQASASKGIDLQKDRGILNVSAEWARSVKKLVSPYSSYSRAGFSAVYSNSFKKNLRFEAGFTGNVGGMNEEDDPDSYKGEYKKERDNNFRFNTSLTWQLNRPWITQLKFDASVNFNDNYSHHHRFMSAGSYQPAVHAEQEGYFLADILPNEPYFSDA
ncbi:MAG: carboxypeptidase-like regulatory domain-containing protein, partial [Bacteroidales bacterium]|nr:carboxypeptidase-like regulatory domain-containing protein [Bacteroidales bacterium]